MAALAAIGELIGQAARHMEEAHRGGWRFEAQLFRTDGLVRSLRVETGLPVHDVKLVMGLCDRLAVLDFGKKIAEDVPAEVQRNDAVIAAYLGGHAKPRAGATA